MAAMAPAASARGEWTGRFFDRRAEFGVKRDAGGDRDG